MTPELMELLDQLARLSRDQCVDQRLYGVDRRAEIALAQALDTLKETGDGDDNTEA
ncbi:MAG: hypothetical protein KY476_00555 [Planctomycetes bacterium]|nr:hypothetical protein [Planctomycetota bacterium]